LKPFDVFAYGVIAASRLHLLRQPFPAPDGYAEIAHSLPMTGGEALNSAIVLSRLGLRVQLDGNWLGDNPQGRALLETIRGFHIDASRLRIKKGYAGVNEIVFSDEHTRTIFGNYVDLLFTKRQWNIPHKSDLAGARMACLDPQFKEQSELVARWSTDLALPFVTIDCPPGSPLTRDAAALVISAEFRGREFPEADIQELFSEYLARAKGLVVFTDGARPVWYGRPGSPFCHFQPYQVEVVDSAGAGDAFRAGVVFGLLRNWSDERIIQYASALSGMVCTRAPGVLASPTRGQVSRFLQAHPVP
jgi:sugar/nucleoside kinase (ribokinase family)